MRLNNIYIICIVLMAFFTQSCSKMNDLHQPYLDEGEIIYAAKVDSVTPGTGKNRIQLELIVVSQRIETVRIFWNDYKDSVDVAIGSKTGSFKKILSNMAEKNYIFQLVSLDQFGHRSLPFEVTGTVYGSVYESKLVTRSCTMTSSNAGLVLTFSSAAEGNLATIVTYTNSSGVLSSVSIPATDNSCILADYKSGSQISLKSSYGAVNGIDTFYSATNNPAVEFIIFDKKDWKIIDYSTQHSAGENAVINFIDGTDGTRWHSRAGGSSYPHFATIDMGAVRTISQFGVWRTTFDGGGDNRAPDKIQFLISLDNINWTDLGIFPFNRFVNGEQIYPMPSLPQARYFKFVGVSGPENNMVIGEISAY